MFEWFFFSKIKCHSLTFFNTLIIRCKYVSMCYWINSIIPPPNKPLKRTKQTHALVQQLVYKPSNKLTQLVEMKYLITIQCYVIYQCERKSQSHEQELQVDFKLHKIQEKQYPIGRKAILVMSNLQFCLRIHLNL